MVIRVKHSFMAQDENGNEVFVAKGDKVSEIEDAGPSEQDRSSYDDVRYVTFRLTTPNWSEVVIVGAVALLKALE